MTKDAMNKKAAELDQTKNDAHELDDAQVSAIAGGGDASTRRLGDDGPVCGKIKKPWTLYDPVV